MKNIPKKIMVNKEQVAHIAKLARIKLTEKELEKFQKELSSILDYFNLLEEVDVLETELTSNMAGNFFREDNSRPELPELIDELINSAPQKKGRHIKVKAIF